MNSVRIGSDAFGFTVSERNRPGSGPYDFGMYEVEVRNGHFGGRADCYFNRQDLAGLLDALTEMHRDLSGSHKFDPLESQFQFSIQIDKFGHVLVQGELFADAGDWTNSVKFTFGIDQTYLPVIIASLDRLLN